MASVSEFILPEHRKQTRPSQFAASELVQTRGCHPNRSSQCGICLDPILEQHATYTHFGCMASFHSVCLDPWVAIYGKCPNCRGDIDQTNRFDVLDSIPNFQMLSEVAPDMDDEVSQWLIVDIEADMEDEDWERIESARQPMEVVTREIGCNAEMLDYWMERARLRAAIGEEAFNKRPDLVAQQEYQRKCNNASWVYQEAILSANGDYFNADRDIDMDIDYYSRSARYKAHYDLWSHTVEQKIIRENKPEGPETDSLIAATYDPQVPKRIQDEYGESVEALKHMLLCRQVDRRLTLLNELAAAIAIYKNSLEQARAELEAGGWTNNPPDPAKFGDFAVRR